MNNPIYLDNNATTPLDPRVLEAMMPFFREEFGNASSRHHSLGCRAATAVERARKNVAAVIAADPREIIFTSGATESNNLAIKGVATSPLYGGDQTNGARKHIITVKTEHKAVLDTCAYLQNRGCDVTYLPVDAQGGLELARLADAMTDRTVLVTIMHANNETGVLHPIGEIARLCKERGIIFHTDATQAYGKEPIEVNPLGIDLLSLSAHKFHGPKGIGALYVRRKQPRVRLEPLIHGGGHEREIRSGTLNVPGIVGMGAAAAICQAEGAAEQVRLRRLRDSLESRLLGEIEGAIRNGHPTARLAGTTNLSFAEVDGDALMRSMPGIAVSSSSACTSASLQPSYVLGAMGASDERIRGSIRFSLGRFTTEKEIDAAVSTVVKAVALCRSETSSARQDCEPGA